MQLVTHCPVCAGTARLTGYRPNEEELSVAQFTDTSTEYYDGPVVQYDCDQGHTFYVKEVERKEGS